MPATSFVAPLCNGAMALDSFETARPECRADIEIDPIKTLRAQTTNASLAVGFNNENVDPASLSESAHP